MDRDSLEKRSNLAAQADIVAKIGQLNEELKQLKDKYVWTKEKNFSVHYGCSARDTLDQYAKRLSKCCGQGGNINSFVTTIFCRKLQYNFNANIEFAFCINV